ncbi:carboxylating nicotinate-nucleotide diphosphorylase [Candidatus Endowatersipora endosymbiont of Watersipora subatra]|uniref:carboxylating nicotinate-nucleotide diphosphorylase n=1 Tax=Candidatus Endowatersipora endosymbiont of Watersipora subatra TaxID=3077946 RepID=UPI00312CC27B
MISTIPSLSPIAIKSAVQDALSEDFGLHGDITSSAIISSEETAKAVLTARDSGIIAGIAIAHATFFELDEKVHFIANVRDGEEVKKGTKLAVIKGSARALLGGERVALNYLCHLSGIASYTAKFVKLIQHTHAKVCCTRKTIPGLRTFEKFSVKCGGGSNHRYSLGDAILIKDNHISVAGGVIQAIKKARNFCGHLLKIEVEVNSIDELKLALTAKPDIVMLDNMTPYELRKGVELVDRIIPIEASGNVSIDTIKEIAETGVDYISTSQLTMNAPILDLSLDVVI